MADAVSAALDYKKGRWVFINIINALKPVDGCRGTADRPDLGIVASTDPIAADRAALDIVYGLISDPELRKEWEREHSVDVLDMPKGKDSALRPTVCRKLTDKYGLCLNLRRRRIE